MAGVIDVDRTRTRRDRTFVGTDCAICDEPLEHTLRGERVLQFSCTHVSHEACFYEYIREYEGQYCPTCDAPLGLDTSRGGNMMDLEKLSNIVRSVTSDAATQRSGIPNLPPWEAVPVQARRPSDAGSHAGSHAGSRPPNRESRDAYSRRDSRDTSSHRERERVERLTTGSRQQHSRNGSVAGSSDYNDSHHHAVNGRRHDYDVQAMESDISSRPTVTRNPIPAPTVTIRSEFPTLNRSRQQQSLTCLITVEVPEGSWHPDANDLNSADQPQDEPYGSMQVPAGQEPKQVPFESQENLDELAEELRNKVDNWHGLEFNRFGKLRLHGHMSVGKDRASWQDLECYLFGEMLICVKEKKAPSRRHYDDDQSKPKATRCTLKGSILIKKHLNSMEAAADEPILALNLSVTELPCFYLRFPNRSQLDLWRRSLLDLHPMDGMSRNADYDLDASGTEEDDYRNNQIKRQASINSSYGAARSINTTITDYTNTGPESPAQSIHIPLDLVVVIPISSSMQGLKITLLRDALKFLVQNLGPRDRMGLVTFGSNCGGAPIVGMTTKSWGGWPKVFETIRPVGQKSLRADVVEGANVAMDLLMQRKASNPISTILLISDTSTSDPDSVDFVVSRAEAAKVNIHSFGLGLTHKPDTIIELSTRTKGSYLYVKDWMMLRECLAGCLGALQTTSHQNVKLKLRLPEGSPAKFVKISGALHTTKRATGRDAEAALGDFRFGDKRDVLVQLVIPPDNATQDLTPQDAWESLVSGLEALGGMSDGDDQRVSSVEEVPLIQADLTYGDLLREGHLTHPPRPSLLAITMLPPNPKAKPGRPSTPAIPPHPSIVQRRMELLTSDMLTRALTLISRGQHDRAQHLLTETRSILKGLGKGGLPPLPGMRPAGTSDAGSRADTPTSSSPKSSMFDGHSSAASDTATITSVSAVDGQTMTALDADLQSALEWINHPAVFSRDSRKAVLQGIGVISSQRAYTFRSPSEAHWAQRVAGVRLLTERSKEWRETGDDALTEE
ncbi:von Willebrand and RING finger domain protein [Aspergillus sclerotioniger CBS 115572]|uniref:von Willebrand and RING finger domain protein n=1 Tax=Aspergillus sclerotioniger CBS 115572 TaxID=1450535 RepID=A0A317VXV3_9EURO|nr:von Willebrand and RING finger domain protein [Aspergillus sclerotioniger CBS 115572]PWY78469.1 von Willebrand and RING finger domain protein [Aspergillus sclerotioniger CBS 115572]